MSKKSIEETKQMLVGVNELSLFIVSRIRDGADFQDVLAIWEKFQTDEEFRRLLAEAWEGSHKITDEVNDLDVKEAIELLTVQMQYLGRYVDEFKDV